MKEIKQVLLDKPQSIVNILEQLNFYKVRIDNYNNEIICGNSENGKGGSIHVRLDQSLIASDFKYGVKGDIIGFLMKKRNLEFRDVINIIKKELGIDDFRFIRRESNKLFGGAYSRIKKRNDESSYKILDESILNPFLHKYNLRFLYDGISFQTQKKFQIGFDIISQRITLPWRDYEGNLVGVVGRYNGNEEDIVRWLSLIRFSKRDLLYGYSQNYQHLDGCDTLYIIESEKGVLQLDSMDIHTGLGMGRSKMSLGQIKKIISLNPKKIIYCLDEGLPEEISIENAKLTKKILKYHDIEIGYIYDKNNDILPKDSKCSPTDLGKEMFLKLVNEKVIGV